MTTLRVSAFTMPSSLLQPPSTLPDLGMGYDLHQKIEVDASVSTEESRYIGYAPVNGYYPYSCQSEYGHDQQPHTWKTIVLENDFLRATFMPAIGGRLWSLYDKIANRELLSCNPVFQPRNLAIRNAWVSGGVEWNIGMVGHSPLTMEDMACEQLSLQDGTPVLRMYQYERIRRLLYRIEAFLPNDAHQLYIRVRIDNPLPVGTAVYWWSNMAVPETERTRVIAPANKAFFYGYSAGLKKVPIPYYDLPDRRDAQRIHHVDLTRSTQLPGAMDIFFDIPPQQQPYLAVLGEDGYGIAQTSTAQLRGRKLFAWGMTKGGENWQNRLSNGSIRYLEVQSGLAPTQLEHRPMAPYEQISWLEAYGPLQVNPDDVFVSDWQQVLDAAEPLLVQQLGDGASLDRLHQQIINELDGQQGAVLHACTSYLHADKALYGSAFSTGGMELHGMPISETERPWIQLANQGILSCPDPQSVPESHMSGTSWLHCIEKAIANGRAAHWYGYYHLGVMQYHAGQLEAARSALEHSLALADTPWALRCLAMLDSQAGLHAEAADRMLKASRMTSYRPLSLEVIRMLHQAGRHQQLLDYICTLPTDMQEIGRIQMYVIWAHVLLGHCEEAETLLKRKILVDDIREGEETTSDIWFALQALKQFGCISAEHLANIKATKALPAHLDLRMS